MTWTPEDLHLLDAAGELRIAVRDSDGSLRPEVPIWVVRVGERAYVRSWYRRDTGWFGHAVRGDGCGGGDDSATRSAVARREQEPFSPPGRLH
ncbi:DUF2255 family protein [Streptomyces seoulensis]|uniref:DUF2255 family protein n=1 Tax=Streptomyces seoulensis TaxID=73044 RepID=UPI003C2FE11C